MDAAQLRYHDIVQSGPNTTIASFYVPKVSEKLWKTPNIILGRM
jgi:hypothetical protein